MEVRATEAEAGKGGATRLARLAHPGTSFVVDVEGAVFQVDLGIGLLYAQSRRINFVIEGQSSLDQTGRARGGFGVTHLRFDRAQGDVALSVAAGRRVNAAQALEFDHVTDFGAGTVGLHQTNLTGRNPGSFVGVAERTRLPLGVGSVNGARVAVRSGAHSLDHGINAVAIGFSVRQALEDHHTEALSDQGAVGSFRKRADLATG